MIAVCVNRYYICVNYSEGERPWLRITPPNVLATIVVNPRNSPDRVQACTLLLHKPVGTSTLFGVICKTPLRSLVHNNWYDNPKSVIEPIMFMQGVFFRFKSTLAVNNKRLDNPNSPDRIYRSCRTLSSR